MTCRGDLQGPGRGKRRGARSGCQSNGQLGYENYPRLRRSPGARQGERSHAELEGKAEGGGDGANRRLGRRLLVVAGAQRDETLGQGSTTAVRTQRNNAGAPGENQTSTHLARLTPTPRAVPYSRQAPSTWRPQRDERSTHPDLLTPAEICLHPLL